MNTVINAHSEPALDENGLLIHAADWNESVSLSMARNLGIEELTPDHWQVIYALRKYYARFGVAPAMYNICHDFGHEADWVHQLFGNCLNAWRIAGLPEPGEEAMAYLSNM